MSEQFNGLTPAEAERLFLLLEELGETQQIIGKVLRHGYESCHPDGGLTNRYLLMQELGDVMYAAGLMMARGDIYQSVITRRRQEKALNVQKYFHHQGLDTKANNGANT